ncbi:hypothetical protein [Streptomyces millisiae]|uniref:Uncharacterized protein n=1 Tax=Streptomyces millisiae TaxID=3075542 RepID=A0ABU2LRL8_9ACTN|nr:hypothetical protein [Streptomyces sp. DSM 44918]MDT0320235.1 hypothetical protein [Streptomyces sp. DSM 44918]
MSRLTQALAEAAAKGVVTPSLLEILGDSPTVEGEESEITTESLQHTYARRARRLPSDSFEHREASRLLDILEETDAEHVKLLSVTGDSGRRTLLLMDTACHTVLYWSPMWVLPAPT